MDDKRIIKRARKRVYARLSFYFHLAVFIIVNLLLIYINLSSSAEYLWFKWPLIGWGLGLFFHGLAVFFFLEFPDMKDRMIEDEINKQKAKNSGS